MQSTRKVSLRKKKITRITLKSERIEEYIVDEQIKYRDKVQEIKYSPSNTDSTTSSE